jgi:hypothetical protein
LPDQDASEEWRRLTVTWKTYLAVDEWDLILNSLSLTDVDEMPAVQLMPLKRVGLGVEAALAPPATFEFTFRTVRRRCRGSAGR